MARRNEIGNIERAGPSFYRDAPVILWGDEDSGFVNDVLNIVSENIILAEIRLAPGQSFRASDIHKPIYDSDVCLYVLEGEYTVQLPETGEVHIAKAGQMLFMREPVWHFGHNFGEREVRVLETIAPPAAADRFADEICPSPALGADRKPLADFPLTRHEAAQSLKRVDPSEALPVITGKNSHFRMLIMASTPRVSLGLVDLLPGQSSDVLKFSSDATVYVERGCLTVRNLTDSDAENLNPGDAYFLPAGIEWQVRNHSGKAAFGQIALAGSFESELT